MRRSARFQRVFSLTFLTPRREGCRYAFSSRVPESSWGDQATRGLRGRRSRSLSGDRDRPANL